MNTSPLPIIYDIPEMWQKTIYDEALFIYAAQFVSDEIASPQL